MELSTFISAFDKPDSIILLEGKRKVKEEDKSKLIALGELLAVQTRHMIFRSGNADGSDQLFSQGVANVDASRLQNILPYATHRKKYNLAKDSIGMDQIDLSGEPEIAYLTKTNKRSKNLIDQYLSGKRNRYTIKAAYLLRDTVKVVGIDHFAPATAGIFYDDLDNPVSGGTGHTINMCKEREIPWLDQKQWMKWV